jgi:type I restriction-modification system DNA methylase subunit
MQKEEERYLEIASKYDSKELQLFAKALAALVDEMGNLMDGFSDPMGDYFQEFITKGHNGQFFTPLPITELMAQINLQGPAKHQNILDPAAGSARTILSAAKIIGPNNFFFAADNDRSCAMMSAINMCLHGLPGEVACMNSLSNEFYFGWKIRTFPIPHLSRINESQSYIVLRGVNKIESKKDIIINPPQLSLF